MPDLFDAITPPQSAPDSIAEGAMLFHGAALAWEGDLLVALGGIVAQAPFRHMVTPGGFTIAVAVTSCGAVGWVADRRGYHYSRNDPDTGHAWPPMPACFRDLAAKVAEQAGYSGFRPDSCLINRYQPGARLSLHQDRTERDLAHPIVSVSLGLPAIFRFGGLKRHDPVRKFRLKHGDMAVWGGPARLCYHGIARLEDGVHDTMGRMRISLTFRVAL